MIRDWGTLPYIMRLRKIRLGHYFYKKKQEKKPDESNNEPILCEEGIVNSEAQI